jgi:hypothetical protein
MRFCGPSLRKRRGPRTSTNQSALEHNLEAIVCDLEAALANA